MSQTFAEPASPMRERGVWVQADVQSREDLPDPASVGAYPGDVIFVRDTSELYVLVNDGGIPPAAQWMLCSAGEQAEVLEIDALRVSVHGVGWGTVGERVTCVVEERDDGTCRVGAGVSGAPEYDRTVQCAPEDAALAARRMLGEVVSTRSAMAALVALEARLDALLDPADVARINGEVLMDGFVAALTRSYNGLNTPPWYINPAERDAYRSYGY